MKRSRAAVLAASVVLTLSAAWALDRYGALSAEKERFEARVQELGTARKLLTLYPQALSGGGARLDPPALKSLVQQRGAKHGIALVYLTESDKEAGKGLRERQVVARGVGVPHTKWVAFLAEIESAGSGATFKELRLKPSTTENGVYSEAEAVLAYRWPHEPAKQTGAAIP
ncbi:MAG: hypothetical protein HS116_00255 [Planctomycetes bacterium]|nr:hypothetical protein [Planctomycetota bacterium]